MPASLFLPRARSGGSRKATFRSQFLIINHSLSHLDREEADPYSWGRTEETMAPSFTSPPDLRRFQARVWEIVRQIPYGQVATYGQIAELAINSLQLDAQTARAFGAR